MIIFGSAPVPFGDWLAPREPWYSPRQLASSAKGMLGGDRASGAVGF